MLCLLTDPCAVSHGLSRILFSLISRYILQTALDQDGVVVSNDNYRDLCKEKQFKKIIEERIIMYTFANDRYVIQSTYWKVLRTLSCWSAIPLVEQDLHVVECISFQVLRLPSITISQCRLVVPIRRGWHRWLDFIEW